jgi:hypothetical protein
MQIRVARLATIEGRTVPETGPAIASRCGAIEGEIGDSRNWLSPLCYWQVALIIVTLVTISVGTLAWPCIELPR